MKDCDNITGFGCGTRIGFCSASGLGYCIKCKKVFRYYYNYYNGLRKGEGNCPDCGLGDIYGDVIRNDGLGIDTHIYMEKVLSVSLFLTEEQRERCRKDVEELIRIKKLFDEFKENEHEKE